MRTHQVALGQTVCLVPDLLFTPECALALLGGRTAGDTIRYRDLVLVLSSTNAIA